MQNNDKNPSFSMPIILLRLEGFVCFLLSLYLFYSIQGSWWLFMATFFIPDLSLMGYLIDTKKGAIVYNMIHTEIGPVLLYGCSVIFSMPILLQLALIWFCHINVDRMLGLGLKYSSDFKRTHLGFISFGNYLKKRVF